MWIGVGYWKINQITIVDAYTTQRMKELFEKLAEDKKSAFVTPFGLLKFRANPLS